MFYKAEGLKLERFVALKFLPDDVAQDPPSLSRSHSVFAGSHSGLLREVGPDGNAQSRPCQIDRPHREVPRGRDYDGRPRGVRKFIVGVEASYLERWIEKKNAKTFLILDPVKKKRWEMCCGSNCGEALQRVFVACSRSPGQGI